MSLKRIFIQLDQIEQQQSQAHGEQHGGDNMPQSPFVQMKPIKVREYNLLKEMIPKPHDKFPLLYYQQKNFSPNRMYIQNGMNQRSYSKTKNRRSKALNSMKNDSSIFAKMQNVLKTSQMILQQSYSEQLNGIEREELLQRIIKLKNHIDINIKHAATNTMPTSQTPNYTNKSTIPVQNFDEIEEANRIMLQTYENLRNVYVVQGSRVETERHTIYKDASAQKVVEQK